MKRAIALIELIFAIIIIAITLLSIPNIIGISSNNSKEAITQEAVSSGFSYMIQILSLYWDEIDTKPNYHNLVLYVTKGDSELDEAKDSNNNPLGRRVGSPNSTPRVFGKDTNGNKPYATSKANFGFDGAEGVADDIDDFDNRVINLVNYEPTTAEKGDYKDILINISTSVDYISDSVDYSQNIIYFNNPFNNIVSTGSTNIKLITLKITSPNDPKKIIIFRGFSCNIGSIKIKERVF